MIEIVLDFPYLWNLRERPITQISTYNRHVLYLGSSNLGRDIYIEVFPPSVHPMRRDGKGTVDDFFQRSVCGFYYRINGQNLTPFLFSSYKVRRN